MVFYTYLEHWTVDGSQNLFSLKRSPLFCICRWTLWSLITDAGLLLGRLRRCRHCCIESEIIFFSISFNIRHSEKFFIGFCEISISF